MTTQEQKRAQRYASGMAVAAKRVAKMAGRARPRIGTSYPELTDLTAELQRHGVEHGGAPEIVEALAHGPELYVEKLARDPAAWLRFEASFEAMRTGIGEVSPDTVTVGSLLWVYLSGPKFTAAVVEVLSEVIAPRETTP